MYRTRFMILVLRMLLHILMVRSGVRTENQAGLEIDCMELVNDLKQHGGE